MIDGDVARGLPSLVAVADEAANVGALGASQVVGLTALPVVALAGFGIVVKVVGIGYDACLLSRQRPRGDDGLLFGLPDILLHIAGSPFGFLRSCVQSFVTDTNVVRIHIIYNKK